MAESPKATAAESPDSPSQPTLKSNSGASQKRNKVSRACDECRKRKVRCDGAQPCQRCVSAKKECNFVKVVPKRGPPKKYVETLEPRLRAVEQILDALKLDVVETTSKRSDQSNMPSSSSSSSILSSSAAASPSIGHNSPTDSLAVGTIGQGLYIQDGMLRVDRIPCIYDDPASRNFSSPFMAINYTEPAQPKLHPHVIAATTINADLIQVYFSRVHPYLPILHKNTFHKQIQIAPCMLLLNAMYAVASRWHHASNEITNGQPAGWRYYQAAFSLIDIYTDAPRLTTIQALLLLIKYQEHVRRPGYFWRTRQYFQIILQMSKDLGLSKSLPPNAQIDPVTAEQRKRTFWAVYAYDILMSTELGTEPYFNANDSTVDYPNLLLDESQTEEHETMLHFHWMAKVVHLHADVVNFARQRSASGSQERERDQILRALQQRVEETGTFMMSVIKPTSSSFSSSFLLMLLHLSTILLHRPHAVGNEASVSQERCTDSASAITHLVGNLLRSGGLECMYYPIRGIQYTIHCLSAAMTIHQCLSGIQGHQEAFEKSYALMQQLLTCTPAVEIASRSHPQAAIPADVPPSFYNHPSSSQSSPILASSDTSRNTSNSKSRRSSLVSSGKRRVRTASHLDAALGGGGGGGGGGGVGNSDVTNPTTGGGGAGAFPTPGTTRLRSMASKNRLSMPVMGFHQQGQHQQYMVSYPQTPSPTATTFQSMAAADMYSQFGGAPPMMASSSNPSPFYKQALRSCSAAVAAQQQLNYPRLPEGPTPTTSTPNQHHHHHHHQQQQQHQHQQPYMNRVSANHRRHTISGSYQIDLQQQFTDQQQQQPYQAPPPPPSLSQQQAYTHDIDMMNLSQEQDMAMALADNPMEPNIHQDAQSESMMDLLLNNSLQ